MEITKEKAVDYILISVTIILIIIILLSIYNNENYKLLEYEESENVTPLQLLKNNMSTFIREGSSVVKNILGF